eukprot:5265452-Amphidinium_carterae.1
MLGRLRIRTMLDSDIATSVEDEKKKAGHRLEEALKPRQVFSRFCSQPLPLQLCTRDNIRLTPYSTAEMNASNKEFK